MNESADFLLTIDPDVAKLDQAVDEVASKIGKLSANASSHIEGFALRALKAISPDQAGLYGALVGGKAGARASGALGGIGGALGGLFGPTGAMVGGAIGGMGDRAIGGAVNLVGSAANLAGSAANLPAQAVAKGLGLVNDALKTMEGPLGPLAIGLNAVSAGLSGMSDIIKKIPVLGAVLGPVSETLATLPGLFGSLTTSLISFAEKANPASGTLFNQAKDDAMAVIGHTFVPFMQLLTQGVKMAGDALANFLPAGQEVQAVLQEVYGEFEHLRKTLREVYAEIGPTVREFFIGALKELAHWLGVAAKVVVMLVDELRKFGILSATPTDAGKARNSEGAAARQASYQGSEDYAQKVQLAFFSQGVGPTPEAATAANTAEIARQMADATALFEAGRNFIEFAQDTFTQIVQTLNDIRDAFVIVTAFIKGFGQGLAPAADAASFAAKTAGWGATFAARGAAAVVNTIAK